MTEDHSGAIWILGILLVIAMAATSPYWQNVAGAVTLGDHWPGANASAPDASPFAAGSGLMLTAGAFVLVIILAGVAQISPNAGAFALVLLLGLWMLFLVGHTGLVTGFFGHFTPTAKQGA